MSESIAFTEVTVISCTGDDPIGPATVVIENDRIVAVGAASHVQIPRGARIIDGTGMTLLPGLIDAHVHFGSIDANFRGQEHRYPGAIYAFAVAEKITSTLLAGYTTVRDAGGLGKSFQSAIRDGYIQGPRLLISNSFISQTGGHGDFRLPSDNSEPRPLHSLAPRPAICDGPQEVQKMSREQFRQGANQLKVMAGGGIMSPTDPLDAPQFTVEELAAAVYEARVAGSYVMAHVYVPEGILNCMSVGVRSIEHGNLLNEESAQAIRDNGGFLVPTLVVYEVLAREGKDQGVREESLLKLDLVREHGKTSLEIAMELGVQIGSGSDLLGPMQKYRAKELELKAEVMGPMASLISATLTNAKLMGLDRELGTIEAGKLADLILVNGNPLDDIAILQDPDNITMVTQSGKIVKELPL